MSLLILTAHSHLLALVMGVRDRAVQLVRYVGGRPAYLPLYRECLIGLGADPILILFPLAS